MSRFGDEPLVLLRAVERRYLRPDREVRALDGVDLEIERGELVALTGPSGSGKSTLLHVLGLLETPTAGVHRFDGEDVAGLDDAARARRRNREIGFVFQGFHLIPHLSILDNVALPLAYARVPAEERRERARAGLVAVGLGARVGHRPDELSGGEQQRAAIARALVGAPRLVLADEPTGNLDETTASGILELFGAAHASGTTVVLVTHDERVAAFAARRVRLAAGKVVGDERVSPSPGLRPTSPRGGEVEGSPPTGGERGAEQESASPFGERPPRSGG